MSGGRWFGHRKAAARAGVEPGLGGGGGLEKETISPETNGPKESVLENYDDTRLPLAGSILSYAGQARSITRPFARCLSVSWKPEVFLIKAGGSNVLQSDMMNQAFYESEVAFGLTTLLRIKGLAHAVGSVTVETVLRTGTRAYRVTPAARIRGALSEILARLLKRPFHLDQFGWIISGTEVSTVLTAGGF